MLRIHWAIKQKVCRLSLLSKSLTGEEVARQLITAISTELSIPANLVVAFMRDRAAVNGVAMRTVSVLYSQMLDIRCFSHTLDLVGEQMNIPHLTEFTKSWISLFSHSPKSRLAWRTRTGLPVPSYSPTRWWNKFEVMHHIHNCFEDVNCFLHDNSLKLPKATTQKMLEILDDEPRCRKLKMELAMTVDGMEPFVKATYNLEGNGSIAIQVYEQLQALHNQISLHHYPNVVAVAKYLATGNASRERQLVAYAENCVTAAYSYFKSKFDDALKPAVTAFKAAGYFSPSKINELKHTTSDVDAASIFPFLDSDVVSGLKSELPSYLATAEDVSEKIDILQWWKGHADTLPRWSSAFKLIVLVQPSSAAAERVFSLLSNSFSSQQESALEDYIQFSVMLQYNHRKV